MNKDLQIKYEYIPGLDNIVLDEIYALANVRGDVVGKGVCITHGDINIDSIKGLKSVNNIYYLASSPKYNPKYLRKEIKILFDIVDKVVVSGEVFKSFNLSCAGGDSKEIVSIKNSISRRYSVGYSDEADLQINYGKVNRDWQIAVRITPRPLSLREWRVENIPGGLNPTIAYAMNVISKPSVNDRYINVFSGSGTLLIERSHWQAKSLLGIDIDGISNTLAVRNLKQAGLLNMVDIRKYDINNVPNVGKFDVITANLPFGIQQSKGEDIVSLYSNFMKFCSESISKKGRIVVYTIHEDIIRECAGKVGIVFDNVLPLEVSTSIGTKLKPTILSKQL